MDDPVEKIVKEAQEIGLGGGYRHFIIDFKGQMADPLILNKI